MSRFARIVCLAALGCSLTLFGNSAYAQKSSRSRSSRDAERAAYDASLAAYQDLLSEATLKGAGREVVAEARFFLLPPKAQKALLRSRADRKPLMIVFRTKSGARKSAGNYKEGSNGLRINAAETKLARAELGNKRAAEFEAEVEKLK